MCELAQKRAQPISPQHLTDSLHGAFEIVSLSHVTGGAVREFKKLSSEATEIDDAAVVRAYRNFEPACATPSVIDVEPPTAIHAPNVPETAIAQDSLSIPASDGSAIVEAGADIDVYRDGMSGRRGSYRQDEAESQAKASEQKTTHGYSPCQRALNDINSSSVELSRKGSARP